MVVRAADLRRPRRSAPGCPQPPGAYYQQRGYYPDGGRRYYQRYRDRGADPCWQLSPYGNYVWVCR
jgi:hypothetical protein